MENYSVRQLNYLAEKYSTDLAMQSDKEITLAIVRRSPAYVQYASDSLKNDFDVAITCVKSDGRALRFLSEEMRSNEQVALYAVENFCASYAFTCGAAKDSEEIAIAVAKRGGETIALLNGKFLDSEHIARIAIDRNPKAIKYFSERVRSLEDVVLLAISRDRTAINFVSDEAFKSRRVFEKAVSSVSIGLDGKIRITALTNNSPQGIFDEIARREIPFSLSAQSFDFLALDRDKLYVCLKYGEGSITKKGELLRKYVLLEDVEIVSLIIEKCAISHKILLGEVELASKNRKIRVLPVLLMATKGVGMREASEKNERMYLIRSLRRKSPTAVARFKENYQQYLNDREVIILSAEADGTMLKTLAHTEYIHDEQFVTACLKSYVVKRSDGALLDGVLVDLTYEQALLACQRDGRNYYYLKQEFKDKKEIVVASVRSDEEVFNHLPDKFKTDEDVLREKRLWIR